METSGNQWKPVETSGNQWKPVETSGNQWQLKLHLGGRSPSPGTEIAAIYNLRRQVLAAEPRFQSLFWNGAKLLPRTTTLLRSLTESAY